MIMHLVRLTESEVRDVHGAARYLRVTPRAFVRDALKAAVDLARASTTSADSEVVETNPDAPGW